MYSAGFIFILTGAHPLPILPPRGQELLIISPLGEIRKGVFEKL
jgi:hypothetical protein